MSAAPRNRYLLVIVLIIQLTACSPSSVGDPAATVDSSIVDSSIVTEPDESAAAHPIPAPSPPPVVPAPSPPPSGRSPAQPATVPSVFDLYISGSGLTTVTGVMADIPVGATFDQVSSSWPGELIPIDAPSDGCDWFGLGPVDELAAVFDDDRLVAFFVANASIRTTGADLAKAGNARVGTTVREVEAAHPRLSRFGDPTEPARLFLTAEYLPGSDLGITFYLWDDNVVNYRAGLISYTERPYAC